MTEGNPTVEEARSKVLCLACEDVTCLSCIADARDVDALIEAVRQEERERISAEQRANSRTWPVPGAHIAPAAGIPFYTVTQEEV